MSSYSDWSNMPDTQINTHSCTFQIDNPSGRARSVRGAGLRQHQVQLVRGPGPSEAGLASTASGLSLQDFTPANVVWHPDYNSPSRLQNDIAIVTLDREVTINGQSSQPLPVFTDISSTDYVSHVCLPFPERLNSSIYSPDNSPDKWPEVNQQV